MSGRKTIILLEQVNDAILASLKGLSLGDNAIEGNKLSIDVKDPEKENPVILNEIFKAGGRVQSVNVVGSTLEEAYLKLVR